MKKLTKKVLAAIAASVMAVTAASPSVYANVSYDTIANGWVKEGDTERRYEDGFPYTGWLQVEGGTKKYCLDGYLVTGNFTIGGVTYNFGSKGTYSGKSAVPDFSAECGEVVPNAEKIEFTVYANKDDGKTYSVKYPVKMQRWTKGKWVDCIGKNINYTSNNLDALFSSSQSAVVPFYPKFYTNGNFKEGYYRVTFSAEESSEYKTTAKKFYSVFKVSPKNIYKDGLVAEGSLTRRYVKGEPYTGWTQAKNGLRKYYLDGYLMKDEMQIDDCIYTFNDDGECIKRTAPALYTDSGKQVSEDTAKMEIGIYSTSSDTYYVGNPVHMTRWEYGRWTECKGSASYLADDGAAVVSRSKSDKVSFYPQEYTRYNFSFSPGYYKIDLSAWNTRTHTYESFSTMFEVVDHAVVKNGWVKEGTQERRYKDGRPYTGWVETKTGQKYCFDGYYVSGEFQIGKYNYYFTADGIYTGIKVKLPVTADCGNAVASNAQVIVITVKNSGTDGNNYSVGQPNRMERWENGRWVECAGKGVQYTVSAVASPIYAKSGNGKSTYTTMSFYPQTYTGNNFTPGYYRIVFSGWTHDFSGSIDTKDYYAVFEVV